MKGEILKRLVSRTRFAGNRLLAILYSMQGPGILNARTRSALVA